MNHPPDVSRRPLASRLLRAALLACLFGALAVAPATATASAVGAGALIGNPDAKGPSAAAVVGKVVADRDPLVQATVYAYELADLSLKKAFTDRSGEFVFRSLPAGLYKIIAHKPGFVPAVTLLTRTTAGAYQYIDFALTPDLEGVANGNDYWSIREKIPGDILREIQIAESLAEDTFDRYAAVESFEAEMQALAGAGAFNSVGDARMSGGMVGLQTRVGDLGVGVRGSFRELAGQSARGISTGKVAETSALAVTLNPYAGAQLQVTGHKSELMRDQDVDLEHYGVAWDSGLGRGRSRVAARFTEENNYYAANALTSLGVAPRSQTWELEGSYEARLGRRNSVQTGVSYRQRSAMTSLATAAVLPLERIDLFGVGGFDVTSGANVQYGVFTTVIDGDLQVAPHAGFTVDLGSNWVAEIAGRHRVTEVPDELRATDFIPAFYGHAARCSQAEANCYRVKVTRKLGENNSVSVGALQREYTDTLRLFFSNDFLDQFESLFFVAGDRVPEIHFSIDRRLSPTILAHFETNLAEGGGGFLASKDGVFTNEVRFHLTSLDTQFERTATGVRLGYQTLAQDLAPGEGSVRNTLETERLQLQVSQDLERLLGFALTTSSHWTLLLDMQVSRGNALLDQGDAQDVRERVLGGIAVSF